jgi:thioesterase domain-containing protein
VSDSPNSASIEKLTAMWQRVLQRSPIGSDDNFFEIGGDDQRADAIFAEIAQGFGRELPSATIRYAPTITALAQLLEQPGLPRFSALVPLRQGEKHPPIFITPGVGGRASFLKLAQHIPTRHPIYGIQAKGVDGLEKPLERIEEMAAFYLDELRGMRPAGPYVLIGYSFGGLVALEMAQRLSAEKKSVALLVLIDTYPHMRYFPLWQRLWLIRTKVQGHLHRLRQMPVLEAFSQIGSMLARRLRVSQVGGNQHLSPKAGRFSFAHTIPRVRESDFVAMKHYRPCFYEGKIRFVRPQVNSYLPNNPAAIWSRLAAELEIETVQGDHLGMVGKDFEDLAAVLTRYVQESLDANPQQEIAHRKREA